MAVDNHLQATDTDSDTLRRREETERYRVGGVIMRHLNIYADDCCRKQQLKFKLVTGELQHVSNVHMKLYK